MGSVRRSFFALAGLAAVAGSVMAHAGCGDDATTAETLDATPTPAEASAAVDASDAGQAPAADTGTPAATEAGPGGLVPAGCVTSVAAGDHVFQCAGYAFDVHVPVKCTSGGCGIVLDVHGATMSGRMEDNNSGMRAIGEREGYLVVQPNAKGTPPNAVWDQAADGEKVWSVLTLVRNVFAIDKKRVHLMGFSQGGTMTFRLVCAHAEEIASAAPAGEDGCTGAALTAAKREVPLHFMVGKTDALVSYSGIAVPQRDALVAAWALGTPVKTAGDASYEAFRYTNAKGTVFEMVAHEYEAASFILKGHCYPGSTDPASVPGQLFSFACTPPNAFDWGEEAMKFFRAHPLP